MRNKSILKFYSEKIISLRNKGKRYIIIILVPNSYV